MAPPISRAGFLACLVPVAAAVCNPAHGPGRYLLNLTVVGSTSQGGVSNQTRPLVLNVPDPNRLLSSPREGLRNAGVIGFHGWHSNPWYYDKLANLTNLTEHYGAVLALPFGTGPNHAAYYCCPKNVTVEECSSGDYLEYLDDLDQACGWKNGDNADAQPYFDDIDDIAYTKTIAKFLTEEMCVDADKIFATGLSDGGAMTARAACDAADVLAGVASMSGGLALKDCVPAKPIAYLEFCGTLDAACNVSSYSTYSLWAEANECDEKGAKYHLTYESATTRCRAAESCSTLTEQCMIAGLGDDIPGHDRSAPLPPSTINILQAASNVDSVKYAFDKWSALFQSDQWPDMTFPGSFVDSSSTVMIKENVASSSS